MLSSWATGTPQGRHKPKSSKRGSHRNIAYPAAAGNRRSFELGALSPSFQICIRAAGLVSNLLVALLIIGIVRAWELVGDRETGIIASIAVLAGHDRNPDSPLPASALPDPAETERAGDPGSLALTGADDRPE